MMSVDKVIFINRSALVAKYNSSGAAKVEAALRRLVAADLERTVTSVILAIDSSSEMLAVGGNPVVSASDERGAMAAVSAAFTFFAPGYGLIIDGPDVIPHIKLSPIRGLQDADLSVESDLPYASPAGWSRQAASFMAVTRLIGRLPSTVGTKSEDNLISFIDAAAVHMAIPLSEFQTPFVITAEDWIKSTQLSIATTYGAGVSVLSSPSSCHPAIDSALSNSVHFINCHGAIADENFYGQAGSHYPVAMSSSALRALVRKGTVVIAECCYGAELYDHHLLGIPEPICISYLSQGAAAFVGSTCISYGSTTGNGQADLLTQYFLQFLLTGMSSGRALLEARQQFVRTQVMANPANLKTLAQFLLLGDPSCTPCQVDKDAHTASVAEIGAKAIAAKDFDDDVIDKIAQRKIARATQESSGMAAAGAASKPIHYVQIELDLEEKLKNLAMERGLQTRTLSTLATSGGVHMRSSTKGRSVERKVAVILDDQSEKPHIHIKLMVAYLLDDKVSRVEMIESR